MLKNGMDDYFIKGEDNNKLLKIIYFWKNILDQYIHSNEKEIAIPKYKEYKILNQKLNQNELKELKSLFVKTLDELIAFNEENKDDVLKHFDQSHFYDSNKTSSQKEEYLIALERVLQTRDEIDSFIEEYNIEALVGLSWSPAWAINHDGGDDGELWESYLISPGNHI